MHTSSLIVTYPHLSPIVSSAKVGQTVSSISSRWSPLANYHHHAVAVSRSQLPKHTHTQTLTHTHSFGQYLVWFRFSWLLATANGQSFKDKQMRKITSNHSYQRSLCGCVCVWGWVATLYTKQNERTVSFWLLNGIWSTFFCLSHCDNYKLLLIHCHLFLSQTNTRTHTQAHNLRRSIVFLSISRNDRSI